MPANTNRTDVAARYPSWGPAHGFAAAVTTGIGVHRVCAYAVNQYGIGSTAALGCLNPRIS